MKMQILKRYPERYQPPEIYYFIPFFLQQKGCNKNYAHQNAIGNYSH